MRGGSSQRKPLFLHKAHGTYMVSVSKPGNSLCSDSDRAIRSGGWRPWQEVRCFKCVYVRSTLGGGPASGQAQQARSSYLCSPAFSALSRLPVLTCVQCQDTETSCVAQFPVCFHLCVVARGGWPGSLWRPRSPAMAGGLRSPRRAFSVGPLNTSGGALHWVGPEAGSSSPSHRTLRSGPGQSWGHFHFSNRWGRGGHRRVTK